MRVLHALVKALLSIFPKASPDYDRYPWPVAYWLVKLDNDRQVEREIGFTAQHQPVLFVPTDRKIGTWTDSNRVFLPEEFETQNKYPFAATRDASTLKRNRVPVHFNGRGCCRNH